MFRWVKIELLPHPEYHHQIKTTRAGSAGVYGHHITIHYLAALHSQTNPWVMCLGTQTQKPTTTPVQ